MKAAPPVFFLPQRLRGTSKRRDDEAPPLEAHPVIHSAWVDLMAHVLSEVDREAFIQALVERRRTISPAEARKRLYQQQRRRQAAEAAVAEATKAMVKLRRRRAKLYALDDDHEGFVDADACGLGVCDVEDEGDLVRVADALRALEVRGAVGTAARTRAWATKATRRLFAKIRGAFYALDPLATGEVAIAGLLVAAQPLPRAVDDHLRRAPRCGDAIRLTQLEAALDAYEARDRFLRDQRGPASSALKTAAAKLLPAYKKTTQRRRQDDFLDFRDEIARAEKEEGAHDDDGHRRPGPQETPKDDDEGPRRPPPKAHVEVHTPRFFSSVRVHHLGAIGDAATAATTVDCQVLVAVVLASGEQQHQAGRCFQATVRSDVTPTLDADLPCFPADSTAEAPHHSRPVFHVEIHRPPEEEAASLVPLKFHLFDAAGVAVYAASLDPALVAAAAADAGESTLDVPLTALVDAAAPAHLALGVVVHRRVLHLAGYYDRPCGRNRNYDPTTSVGKYLT